jgi:predicted metal-binding membrane protein
MASSPTSTSTATVSSAPEYLSPAERIARHERVVVLGSNVLIAMLAWGWIASGAGMHDPGAMAGMAPAEPPAIPLVLLMWWLMMVAMMLPSAAPMILLYGAVRRKRGEDGAIVSSWSFLLGYALAWFLMSVLATALQVGATGAGLLDGMTLRANSPWLAGATLIAAGLYQWSPLKDACLTQCRSPAAFLARQWRPGIGGALRLGLVHGTYCIGCCWLLMALLFVGGVMNFVWIAALAALVAAEKMLPRGAMTARLAGVVLMAWGLVLIIA